MRIASIQKHEDQGVVSYIGLHVWTLALGGIYLGEKFDIICLAVVIFCTCLRFRNIEIKYLREIGICIPKYIA